MKKTLKLDHRLAKQVRSGVKTSTWRIYDDKQIAVNDELEFIDKVDPGNPSTWVEAGGARVDQIVEKRLGDVTDAELKEHGMASREDMLSYFQKHYGPEVSYETPVKMIHFTPKKLENLQRVRGPTPREVKLYADGGSRGNPGPSATGFALLDMNDQTVVISGTYLGVTTNNQAEYQSLKMGLEEARRRGVRRVHVYMDSLLVINQMKGVFKVRNRDLWPIHEAIKAMLPDFESVSFAHVPRELNKIADAAVNEALDGAETRQ